MFKNYLKTAFRNLLRSKFYTSINIIGLAVGLATCLLIFLYVHDELSFDKYHPQYARLAQVMQHQTWNGEIGTQEANPAVLAEEIRSLYSSDFTYVLQASWNFNHTLTHGEKMFLKPSCWNKTSNIIEGLVHFRLPLSMNLMFLSI